MTRKATALGLIAAAIFWSTCSPPPEVLPPALYLTPRPRAIDDQGQVSTIQLYVADTKGTPRGGTVTLDIRAGAFATGGRTATLELDEGGHANVDWSCRVALDPNCKGDVRLEARWESGGEFLVQVVRIAVGPPDGGGGGSDGGADAGVDAGLPLQLDPARVFALGTMQEGACYRDVLADPRAPSRVSVGFPCYTAHPKLQGSALLYVDQATGKLYRFVADAFARTLPTVPWAYPSNTEQNDTEIAPPTGCSGVDDFWPTPDSELWVRCAVSGGYHRGNTLVTLPSGGSFLAAGEGGTALLSVFSTAMILHADGGTVVAARADGGTVEGGFARWASDGGFWLSPKVLPGDTRSLFHIALDGTTTHLGDYAEAPGFTTGYEAALDGTGKLVVIGSATSGTSIDEIAELQLAPGTSAVIYSESNATPQNLTGPTPTVYLKLHASDLVTGP